MIKRQVTQEELEICENVAKKQQADTTVRVPAELLYNLARDVRINRLKLSEAETFVEVTKKRLNNLAWQWNQLKVEPIRLKKEEAASTGMDTTSGVDLTEPTQNIIAQRESIEQYLLEKHLQSDSMEVALKLDPSIKAEDLKKIIKELVGYVMDMQCEDNNSLNCGVLTNDQREMFTAEDSEGTYSKGLFSPSIKNPKKYDY